MHKKFPLNCICLKCCEDWWDCGQIQIIAAQWLMGRSPWKYVEDVRLIIKRKIHTGSLAVLTIVLIWRVKVAVLLINMPRSLTCSLLSMFESSYAFYAVADFVSCSFPYRRSSNLFSLNFILFVSAHLNGLCK